MNELWLPAPDWEGFYEVSDQGRVKSLAREVLQRSRWKESYLRSITECILTPAVNARGYAQVRLSKPGFRQTRYVHRLVLLAFRGHDWRPGLEVCHGPAGVSDNSLSNLSWGTHQENNSRDKARDGTLTLGERSGTAKLTEESVRLIRSSDEPRAALAKRFGVSASLVDQVVWRKVWAHVQ